MSTLNVLLIGSGTQRYMHPHLFIELAHYLNTPIILPLEKEETIDELDIINLINANEIKMNLLIKDIDYHNVLKKPNNKKYGFKNKEYENKFTNLITSNHKKIVMPYTRRVYRK